MNTMIKQKLCAFLLVPVMLLSLFAFSQPAKADADGNIGSITMNGSTKTYSSFSDLTSALKKSGGKTLTIDMLCNWDATNDDQYDDYIYIPEDTDVTLNMHGYIYNRDNVADNDWKLFNHGELIYVDNGATLTINGHSNDSESYTTHRDVPVFTDLNQSKATVKRSFSGGVLAGGNDISGSGGLYINTDKAVTFNNVTIAGCKATCFYTEENSNKENSLDVSGYGGAMTLAETGAHIILNYSRIFGCLAEQDGGGIYGCNLDDTTIELIGSVIDNNFANSDGGGINLDGEDVTIKGCEGSLIMSNKCKNYGGGVYFWNDRATLKNDEKGSSVEDFLIIYNQAGYGGGVDFMEVGHKIKNVTVSNNSGGGVNIEDGGVEIDGCQITENDQYGVKIPANMADGVQIEGATVIKDNKDGGTNRNLYINDGSCDVTFSRSDGMEVYMGYRKNPTTPWPITKDVCLDFSNQLFADDPDYEIVYNYRDKNQDDGRRLFYIKKSEESDNTGHKRTNPDVVTVKSQDAHAYADQSETVYAGGYTSDEGGSGDRYEMRTFYGHHTSVGDKSFQIYYTDGFFFEDPVIYNDHLASASVGLATSSAYLDGYDYNYKHAGARQFMADIGCPDQMIYVNNSNAGVPGTDTIGVTIGSKVLQQYDGNTDNLKNTDYTLIVVGVRGANYEKEWASNVTLGDGSEKDGEALGFSTAADQVMSAIEYYIFKYGLQDKIDEGKVKFWVSGFSRAGATSNITAKRLIEKYCVDTGTDETVATGNQVFGYPIEAPKGGTDKAEKLADKTAYYCIHNVVNTGDIVPYVGPQEMGFKRYGVDHYIPGTHIGRVTKEKYLQLIETTFKVPERASAVSGVTSVTTYSDNTALSTKKGLDANYNDYVVRRDNMVKHLATLDHTMLFSDYFYPYGTAVDWPPIGKEGKFDAAPIEYYMPNLLAFLQQEACVNRDNYAKTPVHVDQDYGTLQEIARAYYTADGDAKKKFDVIMDAVDAIYHNVWTDLKLYQVIGEYYKLSEDQKANLINYLWEFVEEIDAFKEMTSAEQEVLQQYWFTLADTVFNFADGDWNLGYAGQGSPVYPAAPAWVNGPVGSEASDGTKQPADSGLGLYWPTDRMIYALTTFMNAETYKNNNHDMNVCLAWTRTYDSYYSKNTDTGEIKDNLYYEHGVNWVTDSYNPDSYSVDSPGAYIKMADSDGSEDVSYVPLTATPEGQDPQYNAAVGGQDVLLEAGRIHDDVSPADVTQGEGDVIGEAIYYVLYDVSSGEEVPLNPEQLYRGGVHLPSGSGEGGTFMLEAYAKSLGSESDKSVYYIKTGHQVTVDNGSGKDPVVSLYSSGANVTISAIPQDEYYFRNWTVKLLSMDGETVEEDIAAAILNGEQDNATVSFTMPEDGAEYAEGKKYPEGYALEITAVCPHKISEITVHSNEPEDYWLVPRTEEDHLLAGTAKLSFNNGGDDWTSPDNPYPVSWTYEYEGKTYSASPGDEIYGECVYTATIVAPKNQAKDILYASNVGIAADSDMEYLYTDLEVTIDDADGSAVITIVFTPTGKGPTPPASEYTLILEGVDLFRNAGNVWELGECGYVFQGQTIQVTAKTWENYQFAGWSFEDPYYDPYIELAAGDLTSKTITIKIKDEIPTDHGALELYALYKPLVTEISCQVSAPVGGEKMQMDPENGAYEDTVTFKVVGQDYEEWYGVEKNFVNRIDEVGHIIWSPRPKNETADYLTSYTARLTITPIEEDGKPLIVVKDIEKPKGQYSNLYFEVAYSENLVATMHEPGSEQQYPAVFDNGTLSYTFPMTTYKLKKVYQPEDITGVPYGATAEDIKQYLSTVEILLDNGKTMTAAVAWGEPQKALGPLDEYGLQDWITGGVVELPYEVGNPDNISLEVVQKVQVDPAASVAKAVPSVEPDTYLEDQSLTLSCETAGATIYWTTDPDATDDLDDVPGDPNWNTYDGSEIEIRRADATEDEIGPDGKPTGRKLIRLRTAAFKDGMRPDGVRKYKYVFANEIEVPKGYDLPYTGGPQVGVNGSKYYTLEPASRGVTINAGGDAVATDPGSYKVTAKINDGFRWEIIDPETGQISYTTEDQTVAFSIAQKPDFRHNITVDNGSGADPVTYTYKEGTMVAIHALPSDDRYFTNWKVKLLDKDGKTVSEDIADTLLTKSVRSTTAKFVMPVSGKREYEPGKVYPEYYSLEIAAVCNDRITKIAASPAAPVAGQPLAETTSLTFTAGSYTWTPKDEQGKDIQYPISWTYTHIEPNNTTSGISSEAAYNDCVYTASITVSKDEADRIMFAPTSSLTGETRTGKTVKSVTRNDADGSATIVIQFEKTGSEGNEPPEADIRLEIRGFDLNIQDYIRDAAVSYDTHQGVTVTLTAPDVKDESFQSWDLKTETTGITLAAGYELTDRTIKINIPSELTVNKLSIDAQYMPVISEITAVIAAPEGGAPMQMQANEDTLKVRISNQYEIDPDFVSITWTPEPIDKEGVKTADYLTHYTAEIKLVPGEDEYGKYIMVKGPSDTEYRRTSAEFLYAETVTATINEKPVSCDESSNSISYTFPLTMYTVEEVIQPADITGVPYGTDKEGVKELLPATVQILLDDGSTMDAEALWDDPTESGSTDPYDSKTWTATGTIILPPEVRKKSAEQDLGISIKVIVNAADAVKPVVPSVPPGRYIYDLKLTLSCETEGAVIYWTTDPDATDNLDDVRKDPKWIRYDGSEIVISRANATKVESGVDDRLSSPAGLQASGDLTEGETSSAHELSDGKVVVLRTAAFKDGMRPDGIRVNTYAFDREVQVPKGHDHTYSGYPQLGVYGTRFYTLEPVSDGVTIDGNGNAVATDPGTYQVRAKIAEGCVWKLIDPKTGKITYTLEDQMVSFTITKQGPAPDPGPGPDTRDYSNPLPWIVLIAASLLAMLGALVLRRFGSRQIARRSSFPLKKQ